MSGRTFLETSRKEGDIMIIYEVITLFLSKKSKVLKPISKMINPKFLGLLIQNKRFLCPPLKYTPTMWGRQQKIRPFQFLSLKSYKSMFGIWAQNLLTSKIEKML